MASGRLWTAEEFTAVAKRTSIWGLAHIGTAAAILAFLIAIKLLGTATDAAAPALRVFFVQFVGGDASALGIGWLGAYLLGNGSVVAALALSLFTADVVSTGQLFVMIAGSRLGAAAIVVVVGALDYIQRRRFSLQESVSMGLLAFLLTHTIYVPATAVGYLSLPVVLANGQVPSDGGALGFEPLSILQPVTAAITSTLGPGPSVLVAIVLLLASLRLFDRVLSSVETGSIRDRFMGYLGSIWKGFLVGLIVTGVTTSVAFSLGVIVPLYNRDYIRRAELIPYVLGANVGTLFDSLLVAIILESGAGITVVLHLLAVSTLLTVGALVAHGRYTDLILRADERLIEDRRAFVGFVGLLVAIPVGLVVAPLVINFVAAG